MNSALIWMIIGIVFCLMEALVPTAFLESALGISAFFVAILSLFVSGLSYQIVLWMLLSALIFWGLKRLVPNRTHSALQPATEARTTTAIQPGEIGRVIYEGNSWQARCEDRQTSIGPDQEVFVLERKGNTLIVVPLSVFH